VVIAATEYEKLLAEEQQLKHTSKAPFLFIFYFIEAKGRMITTLKMR